MPDETGTLSDAAQDFLSSLSDEERTACQGEVQRFVRWAGASRTWEQIRGQEIANYADMLTGGVRDAERRADVIKKFLAHVKKRGYTESNLGTHLRLKRVPGRGKRARPAVRRIELTSDRKEALEAELESLKAQRPQIVQEIQRAMADKDFRENAPLDAARDRQAHVEGRIREIEATLAMADVVEDEAADHGGVDVGSTVHLRNLQSGRETVYTVVRPGEMDPSQGRISSESPVGKALLRRHEGDEVEVAAPSGAIRFRIERVESPST